MSTPSIAAIAPVRGGCVTDCGAAVMRARGLVLEVGQLVRIGTQLAETIGFVGGDAVLAPLGSVTGLAAGARLVPVTEPGVSVVPFGRVIDALGQPIDRKGPIVGPRSDAVPKRLAPAARGAVVRPLATGIRAIDAALTLGVGQRMAIAAPAGVGKTTLLQSVLRNTDVDAVVVALIGERGREIGEFASVVMAAATSARTIMVAATSDEAPALRLRAADRAHAIAERLRADGKSVLLLFDSMTRVAQAQREIGLAMGEAAGMGAYPPSAFALIPRLVERAGVDRASGGAITALYTVLAEAGDTDDPIVDALRAATDGHILLSRSLAEHGVYPAIDIAASLSRTMPAVVSPEQFADAQRLRRLWTLAEEMRELQLMGAYQPGSDAEADDALDRRTALFAFVAQREMRVEPGDARAALAVVVE